MRVRVLQPLTVGGVTRRPGDVLDVTAQSAAFVAGWVRNGWVAEEVSTYADVAR